MAVSQGASVSTVQCGSKKKATQNLLDIWTLITHLLLLHLESTWT